MVACSEVVFFRRANGFAREKRHAETPKRGEMGRVNGPVAISTLINHPCHKIKDSGYVTIRTQTSSFRPLKIRLPELNFVSSISIILVIKQIGLSLRGRPILLITRMITDRIGLQSVLLLSINHNVNKTCDI